MNPLKAYHYLRLLLAAASIVSVGTIIGLIIGIYVL